MPALMRDFLDAAVLLAGLPVCVCAAVVAVAILVTRPVRREPRRRDLSAAA